MTHRHALVTDRQATHIFRLIQNHIQAQNDGEGRNTIEEGEVEFMT